MSAIQLLPYVEILPQNFRVGSATFEQVRSWALPPRHVLAMLMPNFFGNPAEHTVFDILTGQNVLLNSPFNAQNPQGAYSTMWGIKNYVEGGAYLGILPLLLAIYGHACAAAIRRPDRTVWFFVFLAVISLAFMFGTPLYAILYYGLPGINQLHSPFRWIWPFTISIAVLAAMRRRCVDDPRSARSICAAPAMRARSTGSASTARSLFARSSRRGVLAGRDHSRRLVCLPLDLPGPIDCFCRQAAAIDGAGRTRRLMIRSCFIRTCGAMCCCLPRS